MIYYRWLIDCTLKNSGLQGEKVKLISKLEGRAFISVTFSV